VAAPKAISLLSERPPVTAVLSAIGIAKSFGEHAIIRDLTFTAKEGEFVAVVGPSGCGKTTLLMCIAGLLKIDRGAVEFQGARITAPPPGLAVVFQDYSRSLLPWKSNMENVVFGMKRLEDVDSKERQDRAIEILTSVGLRGFEQHYPWQVSGGMQQRVAIARALAANSKLLLLDEPLAAVDAQTRADMQDLLLELAAKYKQTCLLVTHDVDEAVYVADRAIVLSNRPARVLEEFVVPLCGRRDQIVTRSDPIFLDIRARILSRIKSLKGAGMNPDMIN
jgi:NitT/TauT family transport system ATP-binding protein